MWCTTCRQDVPGVSQRGAGYTCARCGNTLGSQAVGVSTASTQATTAPRPAERRSVASHDLWESAEDLRHVERLLSSARSSLARKTVRLDPPENRSSRLEARESAPRKRSKQRLPEIRKRPIRALCTWVIAAAGLAATTCGGVLIAMSKVHDRAELWDLGLPVALAGQLGLLAALLVHLDTLRARNRETESRLASVDKRLNSLSRRLDRP